MQFRSLTRADEVFEPGKSEAAKKARQERAADRKRTYERTLEHLFKDQAFRDFLDATIEPYGYWRKNPGVELPAFEQGRRSVVTHIVERILEAGGRGAKEWYAEASEKFTDFLQSKDKEVNNA